MERGIDLATAQAFQSEGAAVIIVGRDQKTLDVAIIALDGKVRAVRADISNLEANVSISRQD